MAVISTTSAPLWMGPYQSGKLHEGLSDLHQLADIPGSYKGYIWAGDIWRIGAALK